MPDGPGGLGRRWRSFVQWVKVILLVVLITLLVVLILQNIEAKATIWFILGTRTVPTAVVVAVSFVAGVLVTLLAIFLRRGSDKV